MYVAAPALRTLSEIIVSPNVGAVHLRRVGEVLVAWAEMNERILGTDKSPIRGDDLDELLFSIADIEDAYVEAWHACEEGTNDWRTAEGLSALEATLRRAAEYFLEVASRRG
ncbi:hypothetical protein ACFVXG_31420 [Kitasatospora sp. NPDC058162]|uniref:hypothetical protein n=1 Tax=Kitasatospora sp. NPDC058162 TaxID=3346362 RepID=UPI0036D8573C